VIARVLVASVIAQLAACSVGPIDLEGRRCPCAPGWRCDADGICRRGDATDAGVPRDGGARDAGPRDAPAIDGGPTDGGPTCDADPSIGTGRISSGREHTCAIRNCGEVWCWGINAFGQVGTGAISPLRVLHADCGGTGSAVEAVPVRASPDRDWLVVSSGERHTCGIRAGGAAYCWGHNVDGRLGTGDFVDHLAPTPVAGSREFVAIDAGGTHTCAIDVSGGLYCWGHNMQGQLGTGPPLVNQEVPIRVGAEVDWSQVALGDYHSCALKGDQSIWCWGGFDCGQTGTVPPMHPLFPRRVGDQRWQSVHAGGKETCARDLDGMVACMGGNGNGQLGQGFVGPPPGDAGPPPTGADMGCWPIVAELTPVPGLGPTRSASVGVSGVCAITETGELWCWGYARDCQLGHVAAPDIFRDPTPMRVGMADDWLEPATGFFHNCAMKANGDVLCLGDGCRGTLGIDSPPRSTCDPLVVATLPPRS
jgi:alpha-tubulin suppressor-like RCC1 family protein